MEHINDLRKDEIARHLGNLGQPAFRATQISEWLHRRRATSFGQMTNLPADLRETLSKNFTFARLEKQDEVTSPEDGATKYLLRLPDGNSIETVFLPHQRGATLCISSQVGCAYGCRFCATAKMKLVRNLSAGEIVDQVEFVEHCASAEPSESLETRPFSNIVFMGMGEPFANHENVMKAVQVLIEETGIGARRITVSTCGVPKGIMALAKEPYEVGLAISINSPFDEPRRRMMPVAGRTPLPDLLTAARYYFAKKGRMLTFEYVLLRDVNDTIRDAHALASLTREVPAKINLIALNPFPGCPYERPERGRIHTFQAILEERGKKVTLRKSLGCDILAGCGQLGAKAVRRRKAR